MLRLALLFLLLHSGNALAGEDLWKALAAGGHVVLLRHAATEPGTGDPPGFRLEDCATQRNLSDEGRAQARRLGEAFRARGVPVARVVSSRWCRCLETARLAFGRVDATHEALANLHGRGENRERQLRAFRQLLQQAPAGGNLVLVTHGSTTVALTGEYPAMGEAIVFFSAGDGRLRVAGRLQP